ncbi:MAG: hypothetical protein WED87_06700 [Dehalococcoidia bacterium]
MDISQFYDTTITDCDNGLAVRVIVIPHRSMAPYVKGDLVQWASLLGLTSVALLESEQEMISVLASTLSPGNGEAHRLARLVVMEPRIPFSNGDLRLLSLAQIARDANVPLPSVVSLVSSPESRLLLVAVPEGVAICGGASGMAGALGAGLSSRIREVMGLDGRKFRSTGPAARN